MAFELDTATRSWVLPAGSAVTETSDGVVATFEVAPGEFGTRTFAACFAVTLDDGSILVHREMTDDDVLEQFLECSEAELRSELRFMRSRQRRHGLVPQRLIYSCALALEIRYGAAHRSRCQRLARGSMPRSRARSRASRRRARAPGRSTDDPHEHDLGDGGRS